MSKIKILDTAKIGLQNKITLKAVILETLGLESGDRVVFECEMDEHNKTKVYVRGDVTE